MKVKDLIALLSNLEPDVVVRVESGGSIYATDNLKQHTEYNGEANEIGEFFVMTVDSWPEEDEV
jgi:hypothetical protein